MSSTFGKMLREARREAGWTQTKLGNYLGYSAPHVCDLEHGRRGPPSVDDIVYLSGELGVKAEPFLMAALREGGIRMPLAWTTDSQLQVLANLLMRLRKIDSDSAERLLQVLDEIGKRP